MVDRYTPDPDVGVFPAADGGLVKWSDYDALAVRLAEAENLLRAVPRTSERESILDLHAAILAFLRASDNGTAPRRMIAHGFGQLSGIATSLESITWTHDHENCHFEVWQEGSAAERSSVSGTAPNTNVDSAQYAAPNLRTADSRFALPECDGVCPHCGADSAPASRIL